MKLWPEPKLIKRWLAILVLLAFSSHAFVFLCQERNSIAQHIIKATQAFQETCSEVHTSTDVALPKLTQALSTENHDNIVTLDRWRLSEVSGSILHLIFVYITTHAP